jgi:protease I
MARIAFILADQFEDAEFRVPYDRLKEAGHDLKIIGEEEGKKLEGKGNLEEAITEVAATDARSDQFDALVIPGGYSPDKLRMVEPIVRMTREMFEQGKPIAAICHAGSLLVEADVVRGKTVTSWPSIRTDLRNAGANWKDEQVIEDGNLITSRKPADLEAFCKAILDQITAPTRT